MTAKEILQMVDEECRKAGLHYVIQVDDGEHISGKFHVITNSKLHDMGRACNSLADKYEEHEIK